MEPFTEGAFPSFSAVRGGSALLAAAAHLSVTDGHLREIDGMHFRIRSGSPGEAENAASGPSASGST